jgi:WhiB family redox-sensing transcriptional regulator
VSIVQHLSAHHAATGAGLAALLAETAPEFSRRPACADVDDPELFHPLGESSEVDRDQIAQAKAVCSRCPVVRECRAWALQRTPSGVWGATTEGERERALRRRAVLPNPELPLLLARCVCVCGAQIGIDPARDDAWVHEASRARTCPGCVAASAVPAADVARQTCRGCGTGPFLHESRLPAHEGGVSYGARGLCKRCYAWARYHGLLHEYAPQHHVRRSELVAAYRGLLEQGLTRKQIAIQLNVTQKALDNVLYRARKDGVAV